MDPAARFLYYYFSVYLNLSKNSFLCARRAVTLKADAKVRLFSEPPNFWTKKNHFSCKKVAGLDLSQDCNSPIPYYINIRAGANKARKGKKEAGERKGGMEGLGKKLE